MAKRISLRTLWESESLSDWHGTLSVREMSLSDVCNSGNNFSGYAQTPDHVVQSDLVGDRTKERCQCVGVEEDPWSRQLSDSLVVAAQDADCYGEAGT